MLDTDSSNSPILQGKNLSCIRGNKTLFSGLDFELKTGACLHITGVNGSGKTSLLRMLCGFFRSEQGDLLFEQRPIEGNSDYLDNIAYIAHKDGLKGELTASENLAFYQRLETAHDDDLLDDYLLRLGILHCADQLTQQLSFGQRRRLSFARLLVKPFKIWILDEPFTGIDADGRNLIESLCCEHLNHGGAIALTHHQNLTDSSLGTFIQELAL